AVPPGRDVVPARPGQRPDLPGPAVAGRPPLPPPPARRGGPHRLPRVQLVAGPPRPLPRHPRLLLRAPAAVGLVRVARAEDETRRGPRAVYPAVRGGLVPPARRGRPPRRAPLL